jgi:hypothetical protein
LLEFALIKVPVNGLSEEARVGPFGKLALGYLKPEQQTTKVLTINRF